MDDRFGGISMDDIMNASGFDDDAQPAAPQGQQPVQAGYPQQGYPQQPDYQQQSFAQQPAGSPAFDADMTAAYTQPHDPSTWSVSTPGPINNGPAVQADPPVPTYYTDPYGAQPQQSSVDKTVFSATPGFGAQPDFGAQPGYNSQPDFGVQPAYDPQPGYAMQPDPNFGANPGYAIQPDPNFGANPGYAPQPGFDPQFGYGQQGYGPQTGYMPTQINIQAPAYAPKGSNGASVAALVCGILGLIGGFIPIVQYFTSILALLGLILGIVGISKAKKVNNGKGLAIAGLICGILGSLSTIAGIIITLVFGGALLAFL